MARCSTGSFEQAAMLALIRLHGRAYGVPIHRELSERLGREVSVGAVYTTLERLEQKGFVVSERGAATAERGGRAKRFFELTAQGRQALEEAHRANQRIWSGLRPGEVVR